MDLTVKTIVKKGLCIGCGVCTSACPQQAIQITKVLKRGIYIPSINYNYCSNCGLCSQVCPGKEVDFNELSKTFLNVSYNDDIVGPNKACYFGHACDYNIRYYSSSGGLITAILIHLLENKTINGVIVTKMNFNNSIDTEATLAETKEQIIEASGSKYCPTSIGQVVNVIKEKEGIFAVVGLPCQIHGIRKYEMIDPRIKNKIIIHFGLFCANNNTFLGTEYFLRKHQISIDNVASLRYRAKGWPGKILVTLKNGSTIEINRGTTESLLDKRLLFSSSFHYDFMIPRCLLCPDLTNELADISFADAWNKKFKGKETIGKSMIIIRSDLGEKIIDFAQKSAIIELEEITPEIVKESQNIKFKASVGSRVFIRKKMGFAVPNFKGKKLIPEIKFILEYFDYLLSYVSHYKMTRRILTLASYIRFFRNKLFNFFSRLFR